MRLWPRRRKEPEEFILYLKNAPRRRCDDPDPHVSHYWHDNETRRTFLCGTGNSRRRR